MALGFCHSALCPLCCVSEASVRHKHQASNMVPVLTACQPTENGVLAWMTYIVMGLWLSGPGLQDSWAVVSVISSMVTASGGPGGPVKEQDPQRWRSKFTCPSDCGTECSADPVNHLFAHSQIHHLSIPFWMPIGCPTFFKALKLQRWMRHGPFFLRGSLYNQKKIIGQQEIKIEYWFQMAGKNTGIPQKLKFINSSIIYLQAPDMGQMVLSVDRIVINEDDSLLEMVIARTEHVDLSRTGFGTSTVTMLLHTFLLRCNYWPQPCPTSYVNTHLYTRECLWKWPALKSHKIKASSVQLQTWTGVERPSFAASVNHTSYFSTYLPDVHCFSPCI